MLSLIIIILIKSIRPYLKRNLMEQSSDSGLLILETLTILFMLLLFFTIRTCVYKQPFMFVTACKQFISENIKFKMIIICLSLMTIINTYALFELDKSGNSAYMPMIIKGISAVGTILLSCLFLGEQITKKKICGILLVIIGLYVVGLI